MACARHLPRNRKDRRNPPGSPQMWWRSAHPQTPHHVPGSPRPAAQGGTESVAAKFVAVDFATLMLTMEPGGRHTRGRNFALRLLLVTVLRARPSFLLTLHSIHRSSVHYEWIQKENVLMVLGVESTNQFSRQLF
jgi:hypothetical protein